MWAGSAPAQTRPPSAEEGLDNRGGARPPACGCSGQAWASSTGLCGLPPLPGLCSLTLVPASRRIPSEGQGSHTDIERPFSAWALSVLVWVTPSSEGEFFDLYVAEKPSRYRDVPRLIKRSYRRDMSCAVPAPLLSVSRGTHLDVVLLGQRR